MRKILSILQGLKSFQDHLYLPSHLHLPSHLLFTAALCRNKLGVTITTWKMQNLDWRKVM